ncbi:MAG: DUF1704 domain-containing protein [Bdellovibrionota bacterium]
MKAVEAVRHIDDVMFELCNDFRTLDHLIPTNRQKEREVFFDHITQGKVYNPQFEYEISVGPMQELKEKLLSIDCGDSPLAPIYKNTIRELLTRIELISHIGSDAITDQSQKIYGIPGADLIQQAKDIIRKTREFKEPDRIFGIKVVEEQLREQFTIHRIDGWTVREESKNIWLAECDTVHRKINLQPGILANKTMIDQFIRHMIDVSVFRWSNGRRQPLKIFAIGMDGQDETEDGLSLELELRFQPYKDHHLRRYAGRVLAVSYSMEHSFFEVFRILAQHFPAERAYSMTERCKIGLRDTSQKGGFLRDHIYLQGRNKLKSLKSEELKLLYVGKVSLQYMALFKTLLENKEILSPALLPLYLR